MEIESEAFKDTIDENQSISIIREMIQVSRKKLKNDGILFIIWGWVMTLYSTASFLDGRLVMTYQLKTFLKYFVSGMAIAALLFTIYYIYSQRKKIQTYIGISLRYIWIFMFICLVLINLIQANVMHKIVFELQHPIFMIIIAFAILSTGAILRYWLIIAGGMVFGILAYVASYLQLPDQLLAEAVAWIIAFVIPGHILYAKRKS